LPDFFFEQQTKIANKLPKRPQNIPNGRKIYQTGHKIPNFHEIHPTFPSQGFPKFTQIGIFGMKKYRLATLVQVCSSWQQRDSLKNLLCHVVDSP
jgi:hypothetical protein